MDLEAFRGGDGQVEGCATRVDPKAQMLPRVQQPASFMRLSCRRRSVLYGLGRGPVK
ncbi:unnamed protein product, partial [Brassica rapa subsp. trilocularis]